MLIIRPFLLRTGELGHPEFFGQIVDKSIRPFSIIAALFAEQGDSGSFKAVKR